MSTALERRTAKLEQAACPDQDHIDLICRRIVSANGSNEIVRAKIGEQIVERDVGEAEDDFVERVKVEALAGTDRRPCRVILLPQQVMNWKMHC